MAKHMPFLEATTFGSVTIDGQEYQHDVIVRPDGTLVRRKKKLSRRHGSSHLVSRREIRYVLKGGRRAEELYVGAGQHSQLDLSKKAQRYLEKRGIRLCRRETPEVLPAFNRAVRRKAALIHVTC